MPLEVNKLAGTLRNFSLGWYIYQRESGNLILNPPFQRGSVWTPDQQSAFIETLLDDYPLPAIFACEYFSGRWADKAIIIDGKQRLEAIFAFMDNRLTVRGEQYGQQDATFARQFKSRVTIPTIMLQDAPLRECAALYVKLLRSGTAHTEEEIRQAAALLDLGAFDTP